MQDFVYQSAPMRVVFGAGTLRQVPDELSRLGVTRALVLATPRQKDLVADIREMIGERFAGQRLEQAMEVPGREVRDRRQRVEIERVGQVRVDVVEHPVDAGDVRAARMQPARHCMTVCSERADRRLTSTVFAESVVPASSLSPNTLPENWTSCLRIL